MHGKQRGNSSGWQDSDSWVRTDFKMEMPAMLALRYRSVGKEHFERFGINEPQRSGQAGKGVHQFRRHIGESSQIARAAVDCGPCLNLLQHGRVRRAL